jgi:putative ABC transport system permease protein
MMGELIFRNLWHRPVRTAIGVLAIAVEVALVVLIVGLCTGLLTETAKRIEGVGADIMLQPPGAGFILGLGSAPMPIKIGDKIKELKYVQAVAPTLLQTNSSGGLEVIYGIDKESFREVSGGFVFLSGHDMEGPSDVLVDDWAAKAKRLKVGDTYNLFNHDWHVVGIVEHGKGARVFLPLETLQDLSGSRDKTSIFWIRCTRPEHTEDVMTELHSLVPGYTVRPIKDMLSIYTSTNIPGLQIFIDAMIALAVSIGLLVIFLTMYTTVIERTRDIGVLKSLGASPPFIVRALLMESALLCIGGIAAGIALSYAVRAAFVAGFPTLAVQISPGWIIRAGIIALVGTIIGASYPAWVASRKDAVEALTFD